MTAEENERLLARYVREVWDEANPDAVERFAADGFRRHGSPGSQPLDRTAQIQRLKTFREAFPDMTIEVEDVVTTSDRIAFRSTMRGTHRGQFLGIPPTGRKVTVGLVDIIRVENGEFVEQWGGPDMLDLVRQLGATVRSGEQ